MEPKSSRRQIMVRVSAQTHAQISALAEHDRRSVSAQADILLQEALTARQSPKPKK